MADEGTTGADGTIEWRDAEGRLDRADGPARVFPSGRIGSAAHEDQAATCRAAAQTYEVAMAESGKTRSERGSRAEAVVDCVGDRRQ